MLVAHAPLAFYQAYTVHECCDCALRVVFVHVHVHVLFVHVRCCDCALCRVGQNRLYTPCITVYLVIFLPKILYLHRIYI